MPGNGMMPGTGPGLWPLLVVLVVVLAAAGGFLAWALSAWPARRRRLHDHEPLAFDQPPRDERALRPRPAPGDFRASNAERDEVIEQLRLNAGEGRLTLDEFEARVAQVTEAKTVSQLQGVLHDLPVLQPLPRRRR